MQTQHAVDLWAQQRLVVLASEDMSLAYWSGGIIDDVPGYSSQRWQLAVDMIYRCVVSGLLELTYPTYRDDHDAFFQAIRTRSPFDQSKGVQFDESGGVLWNWEQLFGTEKLVALVGKHFPKTDEYDPNLNPAFVQELREIFSAAGVPWSDAPLLPVMPASAGAA
jgi:coproporphyrinogen III oxidase